MEVCWGAYLARGCGSAATVSSLQSDESDDEADIDPVVQKLVKRLEAALQVMGLTKFSSSVAVQFLSSRLKLGDEGSMQHVVDYLLSILNKSNQQHLPDIKRSPQMIPNLSARPVWYHGTRSNQIVFPWLAELEAAYPAIKAEFLALQQPLMQSTFQSDVSNNSPALTSTGFQRYRAPLRSQCASKKSEHGIEPERDELGMLATDTGQWNVCYFHLHGVDFSENLQRCPSTAAAISSVPRHYHHALFSALAPGTHVLPHCGPTNKKLRCHLPIHVPVTASGSSASWLRIADEKVYLQEGKCVIFDDSFEHEAANESTDQPRIVLIIDFWHPDLTENEIKFFEFMNRAQIKAAQRMSKSLNEELKGDHRKGTAFSNDNSEDAKQADFFHVIHTAKEAGITGTDANCIWGNINK